MVDSRSENQTPGQEGGQPAAPLNAAEAGSAPLAPADLPPAATAGSAHGAPPPDPTAAPPAPAAPPPAAPPAADDSLVYVLFTRDNQGDVKRYVGIAPRRRYAQPDATEQAAAASLRASTGQATAVAQPQPKLASLSPGKILLEGAGLLTLQTGLLILTLLVPWPGHPDQLLVLSLLWLLALVSVRLINQVRPQPSKNLRTLQHIDELFVLGVAAFTVLRVGALSANGGRAALISDGLPLFELAHRLPFLSEITFKSLPWLDLALCLAVVFASLVLCSLATRKRRQSSPYFSLAYAIATTALVVGAFHCLMVVFYRFELSLILIACGAMFIAIGRDRRINSVLAYGATLVPLSLIKLLVVDLAYLMP